MRTRTAFFNKNMLGSSTYLASHVQVKRSDVKLRRSVIKRKAGEIKDKKKQIRNKQGKKGMKKTCKYIVQ